MDPVYCTTIASLSPGMQLGGARDSQVDSHFHHVEPVTYIHIYIVRTAHSRS